MTSDSTQAMPVDQDRLARILDDYLVAIEQGNSVSPEELFATYPEEAAQLRGYLSGLQLFHAAALGTKGELSASFSTGVPAGLRTIGDYRLVREIGRGGMGVVYEAWQTSLRRRVALKVLPFTSANDAKQIARFKNEAQAAAQVQHPNIVPVFAVGEESGVHYYVMPLVEGQSLAGLLQAMRTGEAETEVTAAANHSVTQLLKPSSTETRHPHPAFYQGERVRDASQPMRASDTADHICVVARLGIQAAEALQAAHEYGVVHRDVKPSNLLLDDSGKLWVTDFGLARCREEQGLTQTGDVLGTMRYMSPEQLLGRTALIDERTDIYSLGLTMYELATLNHPADDISDVQLLFDRNRPLAKPLRYWNRHIANDFQTIVQKCMAEFPHERYGSAKDLAADLKRFLDGRPILASPPSLLSQVSKWAKRRRGVVYASTAVLAVAAIGAVVTGVSISNERFAAKERALVQARQYIRETGETLNELATGSAGALAPIPGTEAVRREILEAAIRRFEAFEKQAANDPVFANEAARAVSKLGALNEALGDRKQARDLYSKARQAWEDRLANDPENSEVARNLALSLNNLALLANEDGQVTEAHDMLLQARELQQNALEKEPESAEVSAELGKTLGNLGLVMSKVTDSDEAEKYFREAISILQKHAASNSDGVKRDLALTYVNFASLVAASDAKSASDSYQKAIAEQIELVRANPINRIYRGELARTYSNLGLLASRGNDWEKSEVCYTDAIKLQEELVKASPLTIIYCSDLAISHNNLGMVQSRGKRFADAEASFRTAIKLQDQLLAGQPNNGQVLSNQGGAWNNLALLLDKQLRFEDATEPYKYAIQFQRRALASSAKNEAWRARLSHSYFNYSANLAKQGRYSSAVEVALERRKLWPNQPERLFSVARELAGILRLIGDKPEKTSAKGTCIEAAVSVLREAVNAGLSRETLNDAELAELRKSEEYRQALENKIGHAPATTAMQRDTARVN